LHLDTLDSQCLIHVYYKMLTKIDPLPCLLECTNVKMLFSKT